MSCGDRRVTKEAWLPLLPYAQAALIKGSDGVTGLAN